MTDYTTAAGVVLVHYRPWGSPWVDIACIVGSVLLAAGTVLVVRLVDR